jgi:hypothetical protein
LFLQAAIGAAGQHERPVAIRPRHQLGLDPGLDLVPVLFRQVLLEPSQHRLGCTDDVRAAPLVQELQVGLADHPAVHHPGAVRPAILGFHGRDDRRARSRIIGVAVEDLVAQRNPVRRHHQADADLSAIRATVARITPSGHRIRRTGPLEVGAAHVVQRQLVIQVEQVAQPLFSLFFRSPR